MPRRGGKQRAGKGSQLRFPAIRRAERERRVGLAEKDGAEVVRWSSSQQTPSEYRRLFAGVRGGTQREQRLRQKMREEEIRRHPRHVASDMNISADEARARQIGDFLSGEGDHWQAQQPGDGGGDGDNGGGDESTKAPRTVEEMTREQWLDWLQLQQGEGQTRSIGGSDVDELHAFINDSTRCRLLDVNALPVHKALVYELFLQSGVAVDGIWEMLRALHAQDATFADVDSLVRFFRGAYVRALTSSLDGSRAAAPAAALSSGADQLAVLPQLVAVSCTVSLSNMRLDAHGAAPPVVAVYVRVGGDDSDEWNYVDGQRTVGMHADADTAPGSWLTELRLPAAGDAFRFDVYRRPDGDGADVAALLIGRVAVKRSDLRGGVDDASDSDVTVTYLLLDRQGRALTAGENDDDDAPQSTITVQCNYGPTGGTDEAAQRLLRLQHSAQQQQQQQQQQSPPRRAMQSQSAAQFDGASPSKNHTGPLRSLSQYPVVSDRDADAASAGDGNGGGGDSAAVPPSGSPNPSSTSSPRRGRNARSRRQATGDVLSEPRAVALVENVSAWMDTDDFHLFKPGSLAFRQTQNPQQRRIRVRELVDCGAGMQCQRYLTELNDAHYVFSDYPNLARAVLRAHVRALQERELVYSYLTPPDSESRPLLPRHLAISVRDVASLFANCTATESAQTLYLLRRMDENEMSFATMASLKKTLVRLRNEIVQPSAETHSMAAQLTKSKSASSVNGNTETSDQTTAAANESGGNTAEGGGEPRAFESEYERRIEQLEEVRDTVLASKAAVGDDSFLSVELGEVEGELAAAHAQLTLLRAVEADSAAQRAADALERATLRSVETADVVVEVAAFRGTAEIVEVADLPAEPAAADTAADADAEAEAETEAEAGVETKESTEESAAAFEEGEQFDVDSVMPTPLTTASLRQMSAPTGALRWRLADDAGNAPFADSFLDIAVHGLDLRTGEDISNGMLLRNLRLRAAFFLHGEWRDALKMNIEEPGTPMSLTSAPDSEEVSFEPLALNTHLFSCSFAADGDAAIRSDESFTFLRLPLRFSVVEATSQSTSTAALVGECVTTLEAILLYSDVAVPMSTSASTGWTRAALPLPADTPSDKAAVAACAPRLRFEVLTPWAPVSSADDDGFGVDVADDGDVQIDSLFDTDGHVDQVAISAPLRRQSLPRAHAPVLRLFDPTLQTFPPPSADAPYGYCLVPLPAPMQ
jgi:hypothetical protein